MLTFEELLLMSDKEKLEYLLEEEERVISYASKSGVLGLRKIQSKCDRIRRTVKNRQVSSSMIYSEMIESTMRLNEELKKLKGDV